MTREIQLTQGKVSVVDDEDFSELSKYKWTAMQNRNTWYAIRHEVSLSGERKTISMHRHLMGKPKDSRIDHRDGDGLNNTRVNLRLCSNSQNMMNSRKHSSNTSGYKGVCLKKSNNRWAAAIRIDGRISHIGYFGDKESAARAYDEAARKHYGEFARTNF